MKAVQQSVLRQALRLNPVERAELIEALYRSFNAPTDKRKDAAWAEEAESRIDAHNAGHISSASAASVFARIAKR